MMLRTTGPDNLLRKWEDALIAISLTRDSDGIFLQNPELVFGRAKKVKEYMKSEGLETKESFRRYLTWLLQNGYRAEFDEMQRRLNSLPPSSRDQFIQSLSDMEDTSYKIRIVSHYVRRAPSGGIAAHDYALAAYFNAAGAKAKYVTQEERWNNMAGMVTDIRRLYRNWHDFLFGYDLGAIFSRPEISRSYISKRSISNAKLLTSPRSPLHRMPFWD